MKPNLTEIEEESSNTLQGSSNPTNSRNETSRDDQGPSASCTETCIIITVEGEENDVNEVFKGAKQQKAGRKRKSRGLSALPNNIRNEAQGTKATKPPEYTKRKKTFTDTITGEKLQEHSFVWESHKQKEKPILCRCNHYTDTYFKIDIT